MAKNNDIDIALHNKIKNEQFAEMQRIKERLNEERQLAMQTEAETLRDKGFIPDGKGGKISLREQWRQDVKNTIEQDVNSYHDWRAAILGLVKMYSSFVSTNQQIIKESIYLPLKHGFLSIVGYPLNDAIVDAICGTPEIALPALLHQVEIDDQGHLSVDVSRSDSGSTGALNDSEGKEVVADLNILLTQGVAVWLFEQGYEINDEGRYLKSDTGEQLTPKMFDDMKANLNQYLSDYSDEVHISPRP